MIAIETTIQDVDKFKEDFLDEFLVRVKLKTPVDTGKLKAGWEGAVSQDGIEITNTQEYAKYVEDGTVTHAPVGMVKTTVHEGQQIADDVARRINK